MSTKKEKDAFLRGFAVATAINAEWGVAGAKLLQEGGFKLQDLIDAGVQDGDLYQIRYGMHGGQERSVPEEKREHQEPDFMSEMPPRDVAYKVLLADNKTRKPKRKDDP